MGDDTGEGSGGREGAGKLRRGREGAGGGGRAGGETEEQGVDSSRQRTCAL